MNSLRNVDRRNPINWHHPANRDLAVRLMALPGMSGDTVWLDLCGNEPGVLANCAWDNEASPGGGIPVVFDGTVNHFVTLTPGSERTIVDFTFGCWVYPLNSGALWVINYSGNQNGIDFGEFSTTNQLCYLNGSAWLNSGTVVTPGVWSRLVGTFDTGSNLVKIAVNGVQSSVTLPYTPVPIISSNAPLTIGGYLGGGAFQGKVDDFFIVNRVWTPAEIEQDYIESSAGYPGIFNRIGQPRYGVAGGGGNIITASASTGIVVSSVASESLAAKTVAVNATTQVTFRGTASGQGIYGGPQIFTVSASTPMTLLSESAAGGGAVVVASASSGIVFDYEADGGTGSFYSVSATQSISFANSAGEYVSPIPVSARSGLEFEGSASAIANRSYAVIAESPIVLSPQSDSDGQIRTLIVSAESVMAIEPGLTSSQVRTLSASAVTSLNLYSSLGTQGERLVSASNLITFGPSAAYSSIFVVEAITSMAIEPAAISGGRVVNVSAVTSMGMGLSPASNKFDMPTGSTAIVFANTASGVIGWQGASSTIGFSDLAIASVQLQSGGSVPGGDANAGLRAVAYATCSGTFPFSYAETPSGLLILANGIDPMLRWDGLSGTADTAGVQPPATAINMGGQNVGTLVGMRYAYCRFVDANGNYSALGPISNAVNLGRDGTIENIGLAPSTGVITIQSSGHGLDPTDVVVFQGVGGLTQLSGPQAVAVIDPDHFYLTNLRITSGTWTGGGSWTWGVASVVYQNVPVPLESKVVRRQILRNLDGSADVFYVDVDTTDLISSTLSSNQGDESLSACEAVPLVTSNELPYAARYAPPPSHKSIVASFAGRIFACGEVAVTTGNVIPKFGSIQVQGVGTAWPATLAGRFLYVTGAKQSYEIASVNVATQVITLTANYTDTSQPYATYAIRPAPGERRLVYYTEPGLPEAWPPWNSFAIPEEDDEIVGMMTRTGFLYIIENRHIHRFTMQDEPSEGQDFASINRGCINGRCFVQVENTSYLLDEAGIHAFDGGQSTEPISAPIQTIFQSDGLLGGLMVDWSADQTLWHATHDAVRNTIRWFVQMEGFDAIYHAICYDYRQQRWWIEEYPTPITSSTTGVVGYRRSLVGTDARRVVVLGEGALDLVADGGSGYGGTVSSSDSTSLTDLNANFPSNLAGAPVSITSGTGRHQRPAIICDNTSTTLTIVNPWCVIPDGTSTYQVGGVNWSWKSGWFEYVVEGEDENPRDLTLTYQPTVNPATIDMQLYFDHSQDPRDWAYDLDQDGVSVIAGDPNITVNLQTRTCRSGWSLQRFGGHSEVYGYGDQYVQILLAGVQCSESIRVFQINLNGVRGPEDQ